jgi:hypothetical protein
MVRGLEAGRGHRLQMYRRVRPHAGFEALRQWGLAKPQNISCS